jgi:hypothetical protein
MADHTACEECDADDGPVHPATLYCEKCPARLCEKCSKRCRRKEHPIVTFAPKSAREELIQELEQLVEQCRAQREDVNVQVQKASEVYTDLMRVGSEVMGAETVSDPPPFISVFGPLPSPPLPPLPPLFRPPPPPLSVHRSAKACSQYVCQEDNHRDHGIG